MTVVSLWTWVWYRLFPPGIIYVNRLSYLSKISAGMFDIFDILLCLWELQNCDIFVYFKVENRCRINANIPNSSTGKWLIHLASYSSTHNCDISSALLCQYKPAKQARIDTLMRFQYAPSASSREQATFMQSLFMMMSWASYQIRKIAGCACAGNAGNISPRRRHLRKRLVSDPGMHHGTCVTHVPWCTSGPLIRGGRKKRSRHSRRMRARDFAHLVRGPWYGNVYGITGPLREESTAFIFS